MLLLCFALFFGPLAQAADGPAPAADAAPEVVPRSARVVAVYDGDTVTLDTGDRVRLRWVNTPELRPAEAFGVEARELAARLLLNQRVILDYGPVVRDGYGRLIAGISTEDGTRLSMKLLEAGYGHLFVIPPVGDFDMAPLVAAEEAARVAGKGIWSDDRYKGALHITSFHANARGDDRENVHGEYARVCNVSGRTLNLEGYRVTDITGNSWRMPAMDLPPGYTVKVTSGKGQDQSDLEQQLEIFLQSDGPVWNNTKDRITIYDPSGKVLDTRLHEPKSRQ